VLQAYCDANPVCAALSSEFPIELPATGPNRTRTQMDTLAKAGLLTAEEFEKPALAVFGSPYRARDPSFAMPTSSSQKHRREEMAISRSKKVCNYRTLTR
jgi:hypothetical protein